MLVAYTHIYMYIASDCYTYIYYYIVLLFGLKCRYTKMLVAAMCGADHLKLAVHLFEVLFCVSTCFIMQKTDSTIGNAGQSRT